ncbi:MAG: hypothetical protein WBB36_09565 [Chitinophagales bacterium]
MLAKPFIRHFGRVKERPSGGSEDWTGEAHFCNSHMAMRYKDLHKQGFAISPSVKSAIYNSYRRFYSNGYFVNKLEAGFVDNTEKLIHNSGIPAVGTDIEAILKHYADLRVTIKEKETKIYKAGPLIAEHYFNESTLHNKAPDVNQKYVIDGEATIMVVFSTTDGLQLPKHAFKLDVIPIPGAIGVLKLYGYKLRHDGYNLKVWLIETPLLITKLSRTARDVLRNLRINLLRIHLEKETMRILLSAIDTQVIQLKQNSIEAGKLDTYIKKSAEKLFQKNRFNLKQESILAFALHSEQAATPESFSSLKESIYYFQDQYTRENIEKMLTGMAPKIVLFICTSPKNKNPLDFGSEYQKIKDVLQSSSDRSNFKIEIEASVKKNKLREILNKYRPDYLHMSMHSSLTEGLYFENENKEKLPMPVREFGEILKLVSEVHRPISVVLSACNSKAHAEAIRDYCNYVIGTQSVFPADAGILYATEFYSTLFNNNSTNIPFCHKAGLQAIEFAETSFEPIDGIAVHQIPVLIS